jgi:hypothetical protein
MLVDPPVAIVGISNWALDSSKMNRAICLQRPEPSESDIMITGRSIVSSSPFMTAEEGANGYGYGYGSTVMMNTGIVTELTRYHSVQATPHKLHLSTISRF